jgi:hypothetical protein
MAMTTLICDSQRYRSTRLLGSFTDPLASGFANSDWITPMRPMRNPYAAADM